jgi:hypothetical protein
MSPSVLLKAQINIWSDLNVKKRLNNSQFKR